MKRWIVLSALVLLACFLPFAFGAGQSCLVTLLQVGHVERVIDGDTFVLYAVGVPAEERVRVLGVDTWEMSDPRGAAAKAFTAAWLARGAFKLSTCKRDSFGRLLGAITRESDSLAVDLIAAGHGVRR
jgi:endonuclease YncB( thermonuclease family)